MLVSDSVLRKYFFQ